MKLFFIFISTFILSFFLSCDKEKKINTTQNNTYSETDSLEYSVLNQTLSLLGENILFNNYKPYLPKKIQLEVFYSNYKDVDKSELFKRILKEKIDTSKVSLDEIIFLNFNDSLTTNKNLKSSKLDLKKINFSYYKIFNKTSKLALNNSFFSYFYFLKGMQLHPFFYRVFLKNLQNQENYDTKNCD